MLKRDHECRRSNDVLGILHVARDTQAKASSAWALARALARHELEKHRPLQWRVESEHRTPKEVCSTPKPRSKFRSTNALVVLIVFNVLLHLLGRRAALPISLSFRTCWHVWMCPWHDGHNVNCYKREVPVQVGDLRGRLLMSFINSIFGNTDLHYVGYVDMLQCVFAVRRSDLFSTTCTYHRATLPGPTCTTRLCRVNKFERCTH